MRVRIESVLLLLFLIVFVCGSFPPYKSRANGTLNDVTIRTSNVGGALEIEADTLIYDVKVYLPDDMAAGDTISGTVVAEPKGNTPEEKEKNSDTLEGLVIEVGGKPVSIRQRTFTIQPNFDQTPSKETPGQNQTVTVTIRNAANQSTGRTVIPIVPFIRFEPPASSGQPPQNVTAPASEAARFSFPAIGQQGRPVEIFGPFDGDFSNTRVMYGPAGSSVQDFEKNTENVSAGFGIRAPLAESPRKVVFRAPADVTGPIAFMLNEQNARATGAMRNLGVRLSAPKTNLLRGERTTLTVEVSGLQGIKDNVPLQLDSKGVITMDGGSFQNLRIKPNEVQKDGRYTTTRQITGQQAGGFTVTATVIVRRFDMSIQDDKDPRLGFLWNSFTGDYVFINPPPSAGQTGQSGGKLQPGVGTTTGGGAQTAGSGITPPKDPVLPPGGLNPTGTGKPAMRGCIITLSHNAPDRRVFARLDACTKTGEASVESTSPKADFKITDKNTTDNTAASLPPK